VLALVKAFLRAGILTEQAGCEDTVIGTPQGGILSPLLANIALSALDEHFARAWSAMGSEWERRKRRARGESTFRLVRYADDFVVVLSGRRTHAEALVAELAAVLAPRGLALSKEKTRITHIDEGIEFHGWRIQRHRASNGRGYVYTYASKPSLAAVKAKVKAITRSATRRSASCCTGSTRCCVAGAPTFTAGCRGGPSATCAPTAGGGSSAGCATNTPRRTGAG
jgi:RNA-directed DNA polymerase